jgi:toxin ParE1/3/4
MARHRLIVRRRAKTDVNQIGVYIGERNLDAGLRFFDAAKAAFKLLAENPGFGGLRTARHPHLKGLRSWPIRGFGNYLVIYQPLREGGIEVLRVLHSARDIDGILRNER